jgi:hypothetical protein
MLLAGLIKKELIGLLPLILFYYQARAELALAPVLVKISK